MSEEVKSVKQVNVIVAITCVLGLLMPPYGFTVINIFLMIALLGNIYFIVGNPGTSK